jgi:hypothetical protein
MKKLNLLIALFVSSLIYSQEITMQGKRFYVNGQQLSTREVKEKMTSNGEALRLFKKGKSKSSTGAMFIGLGIAFTTADLVKGLVSDEKYPGAATYIGAGFLTISVPILIGKNKRIKQGIEMYNNGLKNTSNNDADFQLNMISDQNGCGIQLRF